MTTVSSFQSSVDFDLKQLWELGEIPKGRQFSKEEKACEQHFVNSTKHQDNRFTVKLPFKQDCQLRESLDQANRRFNSLYNRLDSNSELKSCYKSLMVDPTVQDDLYSIIMRFPLMPVALSADIEELYRQVALDVPDNDFHRNIWR